MSWLFKSKNAKIVEKWQKEHQGIVEHAGKVITAYSMAEMDKAKKEIKVLSGLVSEHFMDEDLSFFKMTRDSKIDSEIKRDMKKFTDDFRKTKIDLMTFFSSYSKPETALDDEFFQKFNDIVAAVGKRIEFEENTLYKTLKES